MELYRLKAALIKPGDSIVNRFLEASFKAGVRVREHDIVALASKVVALAQGRTVKLSDVAPSQRASKLAEAYGMSPAFVQVIIDESDIVFGGVPGALLTVKDGIATANGGADLKNSPPGHAVLWPKNLVDWTRKFRETIRGRSKKDVGIVLVDSRVTPLRLGTIGLALASAGFRPVRDLRGKPDLYGRRARITFQATADGVASAAQLLMGETRESSPFVIVRGAPVDFGRGAQASDKIRAEDCLYMSQMAIKRPGSG